MTDIYSAPALLEAHRQQFPALANKAYFNYGGQGPLPQTALEAINQSYQYIQRAGPFSQQVNDWVEQEAALTREVIASELNVPAQTITLTEDVTVGCNIALWGIDWKAGDHLLLSDCEHPGVVATAQEIGLRFNVDISTCPLMATLNQGDPVAVVMNHLQPNTRLVVLSDILWNTGQVLPMAEIVDAIHSYSPTTQPRGILVDAAQSVGVLPLNLTQMGVDFYAFTGHKWWCGPEGLGGLYVRPEALDSLHPTFIGWRSLEFSKAGIRWQPGGRRFEVATSAYPLYAGLRSAIALHHQWSSVQERYQQILSSSKYLWKRLTELPGVTCLRTSPPQVGLVSFQLTDKRHPQLVQFLETHGVLVRTIREPDCVRASVHYLTLQSEIDQLVEKIENYGNL